MMESLPKCATWESRSSLFSLVKLYNYDFDGAVPSLTWHSLFLARTGIENEDFTQPFISSFWKVTYPRIENKFLWTWNFLKVPTYYY